ncbi:MAG: hypothetical protein ACKVOP_10270 [Sphingomonadaceae bacterium]
MKRVFILAALCATPAEARTALGTFERWGAFRDEAPLRCFAIAEPVRRSGGKWRSFASVATWPQAGVRGQLHIRLAREKLADAPVILSIGARRFTLVASGADAWSPDPRADAAIVAAMRSAPAMSVSTSAATGAGFAETYALKGAATAMDAAALGCARR